MSIEFKLYSFKKKNAIYIISNERKKKGVYENK
jgi:hypothetical protein